MKRAVMLSAVAAVLLSVGVGAQGRNFSGAWVIDSEKTAAAGGGAMGGGGGAMVARSGGGGSSTGAIAVGGSGGARGGAVAGVGVGGARGGGGGVAPGLSLTIDANAFTLVNGATTTTYKLDGSVTNIENPTRKISAKASWQGDKIAIETTAEGPNGPIVTHAFWYLEGDYLVRENKSTGPDGQEVVRKTYYKRS
jgi:hypothetical protein